MKLITWLLPGLAAVSLSLGTVVAATDRVEVHGVVQPTLTDRPLTLFIQFYPIRLTSSGTTVIGQLLGTCVFYDPSLKGNPGDFNMVLETGQYQVRVDLLDPEGEIIKSGTYYFAQSDLANGPEKRVTLEGDRKLEIPLEWGPYRSERANFIDLFPERGDFVMAFYFDSDQVSRVGGGM